MTLSRIQEEKILQLLRTKMEEKIMHYSRETTSMPFMTRLVQDDELVASFSFMISLATTLGQSIYEKVAEIVASERSEESISHVKIGGSISPARKKIIGEIMNSLRNGEKLPDRKKESHQILSASNTNAAFQKEGNIADFYMKRNGQEYYFEIKTVKPNIDVFTASKKKVLEWVAIKNKEIKSIVALPYNPYAPEPYERFTEQNLLDRKEEFMVGDEFWDFLGGKGTYEQLLKLFEIVGVEYKTKLHQMLKDASKKVGKF